MIFRESTKEELINVLDKSIFGKYAFQVIFPTEDIGKNSVTWLDISYIGDTKYFFKFYEKIHSGTMARKYYYKCCSGKNLHNEGEEEVENFESLYHQVNF